MGGGGGGCRGFQNFKLKVMKKNTSCIFQPVHPKQVSPCLNNFNTITVQGFLLESFLYEGYVHTGECPGWKKIENVIGGGDGGGRGWNKNVLGGKISKN